MPDMPQWMPPTTFQESRRPTFGRRLSFSCITSPKGGPRSHMGKIPPGHTRKLERKQGPIPVAFERGFFPLWATKIHALP